MRKFGACACCVAPKWIAIDLSPAAAFFRLAFYPGLRYLGTMNDNTIAGLASKLADAVPAGLKTMRDDLEQNFRSVLRSGIGKLDLVTREEFDVQRAVLERTREKLEALEAKLAEFEDS